MPGFRYSAMDPTGRRQRGSAVAASAGAATLALERRGLWVLSIEPEPDGRVPALGGGRGDVIVFVQAVAALLDAGLPLLPTLDAARSTTGGLLNEALLRIRERVKAGIPLPDALAAEPGHFTAVHVGFVRSGTTSGELATSFRRLLLHLEAREAAHQRLLSAALYPIILAVTGVLGCIGLFVFVLPRFAELLRGVTATPPASTRLLLWIAEGGPTVMLVLLAPVLAAAGFLVVARTTEHGRLMAARLLLRLPLFGPVRRDALAGRLADMLGMLLQSGAPLMSALRDTRDSTADPVLRAELEHIRERVRSGAALHEALAGARELPPLLAQLVRSGEASGQLATFCARAGAILEERAARSAQRLTSLAEPVMVLAMGSAIGFVAFALLQAVYSVNAAPLR